MVEKYSGVDRESATGFGRSWSALQWKIEDGIQDALDKLSEMPEFKALGINEKGKTKIHVEALKRVLKNNESALEKMI